MLMLKLAPRPEQTRLRNREHPKNQLMRLKHLTNDMCQKLHSAWIKAFIHSCPKAHQDAVKVISHNISSGSWQQGPCLSLVVGDKSLDVTVHQFVGEIHAVYSLNLRRKTAKMQLCLRNVLDVSIKVMMLLAARIKTQLTEGNKTITINF